MPIYAYRCASCGHAKDVLQRLSDLPLTQCPACGAQAFSKQVTAAGFQLKGSGWYATDFKGDKSVKKSEPAEGGKPDPNKDTAKTDGGSTVPAKSGESNAAPAKPGDAGTSPSGGTAGASGAPKAASV